VAEQKYDPSKLTSINEFGEKVHIIPAEVRGFFPSLFNYGTLTIQNASAVVKFIVPSVKNPSKLRDMILTLADEDRKYHTHSEQPTTNNLLK
jgi:hypothetical protein